MDDSTGIGTASSLPIDVEIPGYRLRHQSGSDSLGLWFSAEQKSLGRKVTVKVLKPKYERHEAARREFLAEMDRLAALDHRCLPRVLDTSREGLLWLVVERVGMKTLRAALGPGKKLPDARAAALVLDAAQALRYLDGEGFAHKNVSLSTIVVRDSGGCRLVTFRNVITRDELRALKGKLAQDVAYIAPEQLAGENEIGDRTPVYQLGAVLFHVLAGEPAYGEGTPQDIARKHLAGPFPSLKSAVPFAKQSVIDLIAACTALDPAYRPSLDRLIEGLEAMVAGKDPGIAPEGNAEDRPGGIVAPKSRRRRRRRY